jgi:DNA-binding MarR family transcriptional regulator
MSSKAESLIQYLDELARAKGRVSAAFRNVRATGALSELESVVLTAVTAATQAPTVPQIGRSLGHARQVVQRAAESLVERGLVKWSDNPDHKRARLLLSTAEGVRLKGIRDQEGLILAAALAEDLDAALLGETVAGMRTIRKALETNLRCLHGPSKQENA